MAKRTLDEADVCGASPLSPQHHKISKQLNGNPTNHHSKDDDDGDYDDDVGRQRHKIQRMFQWIQKLDNDGDAAGISNIAISHSKSSGWGVFSTAVEIPPNSVIVRIPNAAVMSVGRSKQDSQVGQCCREVFEHLPDDGEFILWLDMIHGRRDASHFHHPYLASLPSQAPDVPSWFAKKDDDAYRSRLARLQGTNLGEAAEQVAKELQAQYKMWMPRLIEASPDIFANMALADLAWARGMYMSRRFLSSLLISKDDDGATSGTETVNGYDAERDDSFGIMLPILDLLNHSPHQPITWSGSKTHVTFSTGETNSIAANSQIYNNYGPKDNEMLMMMYGFAIPNNVHDSYGLKLTMRSVVQCDKEDNTGTLEIKDLGTFQIHRIDSPLRPQFPPELWKALNQVFAEVDDDYDDDCDGQGESNMGESIVIGFEAIELLRGTLQQRLAPFDATKSEDTKLEDCVSIYRDGRRLVLEQAIKTLDEIMMDPTAEGENDDKDGDLIRL